MADLMGRNECSQTQHKVLTIPNDQDPSGSNCHTFSQVIELNKPCTPQLPHLYPAGASHHSFTAASCQPMG